MADREELRRKVIEAIDQHRDRILEVAETIRVNPEIGYQEYKASALLASSIREFGYEVEKPAGGLETAFVAARHGRGDGPVIAVLAEYDALPGIGHGCGHNLIAASGLAAAIGLGAVMDHLNGIFEVIGTPAEEGGAGKVRLAQAGIFNDVDASLMVHHGGDRTDAPVEWPEGTCLAVAHVDFEYFGKPAHAAADPYNGANALNGVIKLFTGIDALRQHIHMESRIHGIITHGGDAANVVPKYAAAKFYVRAASRAYLEELLDKVKKIAEGAALMTGTEVKITEHEICYDMRPSYVIGKRYRENMEAVGMEISPRDPGRGMYSTDFGNISYLMPAVTGSFAISHEPIPGHSQQVVDASGSEFGLEQLIKVSKAMALTALDLFLEPELLAAAKEEHRNWDKLAAQ
ncbi:M20 family metallopeptidase [Sphaerobacter sp.]|uniref:M20 family metallopeptidase n=1 Tax=Sphaerobacter sp. TaxID=2099654 RepID=UPI001D8A0E35|nr:M20 family metallopeptidase [Sphaerobacter sp.]MBX5444731.1 M20 family metallopeptidase [Sphaerobacter sp.]